MTIADIEQVALTIMTRRIGSELAIEAAGVGSAEWWRLTGEVEEVFYAAQMPATIDHLIALVESTSVIPAPGAKGCPPTSPH